MMTVSSRNFYIEQVQDVTVLCFTIKSILSENFEFVSDELFELVESITTNGAVEVVLDLWNVRKIDDWGLAMLRAFHETIEAHQGRVLLCRLQSAVLIAMSQTRLNEGLHLRETRGEAIREFADGAGRYVAQR